jgi:hypothetical protein
MRPPSCCQFIWERFPRPRKQFVDPVDRVVGDASEDVAQVGFRIEPVELGRFNYIFAARTPPLSGPANK